MKKSTTTKLYFFGAGVAVCAGCLARLLTLDAGEALIVLCVGALGLLIAGGTLVADMLAYRKRLLTERIMQDEELEPQGSWGVGSDLSSTSKEG